MPTRRDQRKRSLIRMAGRFGERLAESGRILPLELPEPNWQDCQRLARLTTKAIERGWLQAAERIRPRLIQALTELMRSLTELRRKLNQSRPPLISLRDLHAELSALDSEFPTTECNLRKNVISVITEPIVLKDVYLGAFYIELALNRGEERNYSVVALEPHPAASDEAVTHPHVQGHRLCEGEGARPIRRALDEGRIFDFFQIVVRVLNTYHRATAFVRLEEWEGVSCIACGQITSSEECRRCAASGDPLCAECAVICPNCDRDYSPDFAARCSTCHESFCDRCLEGGCCAACCKEARIGH